MSLPISSKCCLLSSTLGPHAGVWQCACSRLDKVPWIFGERAGLRTGRCQEHTCRVSARLLDSSGAMEFVPRICRASYGTCQSPCFLILKGTFVPWLSGVASISAFVIPNSVQYATCSSISRWILATTLAALKESAFQVWKWWWWGLTAVISSIVFALKAARALALANCTWKC